MTTIIKKRVTVILPNGYTSTAGIVIPKRIDVYKNQSRVTPEMIELRPDGELYASKKVFYAIPTYQWGNPTGGAQGKMWKRIAGSGWNFENRTEWELCWMGLLERDRTGLTDGMFFYTEKLPLHLIYA